MLSQKTRQENPTPEVFFFKAINHHVCYFRQGCFEPIRLNGGGVVYQTGRTMLETLGMSF